MSRLNILSKPCIFSDRDIMTKIVNAAIILHNMVVDLRRDGYDSDIFELAKDSI